MVEGWEKTSLSLILRIVWWLQDQEEVETRVVLGYGRLLSVNIEFEERPTPPEDLHIDSWFIVKYPVDERC